VQDANPSYSRSQSIIKSEGVLLAAIPFAGSLVAFAFESGYLSFYNVPISWIQIDLVKVITASCVVLFFSLGLYAFLIPAALIVSGKTLIHRALLEPLAYTLLLGPFIYFLPESASNSKTYFWFGFGLVFITAKQFLLPLSIRTPGMTYKERLAQYYGNTAIFKSVDLVTKQIGNELRLIKLDSFSPGILIQVQTDKLKSPKSEIGAHPLTVQKENVHQGSKGPGSARVE
jgi:hypothetical protein